MAETTTLDVRHSPFEPYRHLLETLPAGMRCCEIPFTTMISVRRPRPVPALPDKPNTFVEHDGTTICWLGPDEWLVLTDADPAGAVERLAADIPGERGATVDVSGQRAVLELTGDRVRDLLSHGCALDLGSAAAPTGTSLTTTLALAGVTVLVIDDGTHGRPTVFRLLVRSSFARYVAQWLNDASMEYRGG